MRRVPTCWCWPEMPTITRGFDQVIFPADRVRISTRGRQPSTNSGPFRHDTVAWLDDIRIARTLGPCPWRMLMLSNSGD